MLDSWGRRLLPSLLVVMLSGCAGPRAHIEGLPDPDLVIELTDTPFFPQKDYQCGPAALATVLQSSGVDITPAELVPTVYTPGRRGSLQVDLLGATRSAGRVPSELDGAWSDVVGELRAGRPVIVLQNLGVNLFPRWHYAVVVGVDGPDDVVVLRSGTDERRETPIRLFLRTWQRGDFWSFTALRPGELPANVERRRYFNAVAALEETGQAEAAELAWRAALRRWPNDAVARFGLGNAMLAAQRPEEAEGPYREILAVTPGLAAVRNNLAVALYEQNRFDEALVEVERALVDTNDPAIVEELRQTKRDIRRALDGASQ